MQLKTPIQWAEFLPEEYQPVFKAALAPEILATRLSVIRQTWWNKFLPTVKLPETPEEYLKVEMSLSSAIMLSLQWPEPIEWMQLHATARDYADPVTGIVDWSQM